MTILICLGVGFIWGGLVVWLVERRRYEELCEHSLRSAQSGVDLVARLRSDAHALATWLMLARERIREASELFKTPCYVDRMEEVAAWRLQRWEKRVKETVWEIKPADIATRTESSVQVVPQSNPEANAK